MIARPLSEAEARRVTTCGCGHAWALHSLGCYGDDCPCARLDETLAQVAALMAELHTAAAVIRETRGKP